MMTNLMTEHDIELIAKARELPYTEWYLAHSYEKLADTDEAREELHTIAMSLYHLEEYHAGML